MSRGGRSKASEWLEFQAEDGKQKCQHCELLVAPKIERLRNHLGKCEQYQAKRLRAADDLPEEAVHASTSKKRPCLEECPKPAGSNVSAAKAQVSMDKYVIRTSSTMKEKLDVQFARAIYACNIPFSAAENPEMKKLMTMARGGSYNPPTRQALSGKLLDNVSEDCEEVIKENLNGRQVTLVQDGWSNVHNNPIIGSCLHTGKKAFFVRAVDTGSEKKTAEYIAELTKTEIERCEVQYGCKVIGFVSDNEAKMLRTRAIIQESNGIEVVGCAAHYLNLVQKDVTPKTVVARVVEVQKYFKNCHQPQGWLREKVGSVKPQLPNDTRWGSHVACVDTFLRNYSHYIAIRSEHSDEIDPDVAKLIDNIAIYRNAKSLLDQLKLVAIALDKLQADACSLGDGVHIWLELAAAEELKPYRDVIMKRFSQWLTPAHMVAYMSHPKHKGRGLTSQQEETAQQWLAQKNPQFLPPLLMMQIQDERLPKTMFMEEVVSSLSPASWWLLMGKKVAKEEPLPDGLIELMSRLHRLPTSSASIERLFSSFGLVQSKIRNQLGNEKAAKLVKCYRMLRSPTDDDWE